MKDLSEFAWRVLRAFHAKTNRKKMIAEYGDLLAQVERDEPHLQPLVASKARVTASVRPYHQ